MVDNKSFYHYKDDVEEYPDCWCYLVVGGRNTGKTYSFLRDMAMRGITFGYIKRTDNDIKVLTSGVRLGQKLEGADVDFSPFKSINRDCGTNVRAFKLSDGIGGFWDCDPEENTPKGMPIGYIFSLHSVNDIKGFDVTDIKWLCFDEFIPKKWERVDKNEGDQLLDLYKTVDRGREHIGLPPLKLICLANATTVNNPVFNTLEVADMVVDMKAKGVDKLYIKDRGIFIHVLDMNEEFMNVEQNSMIYKAMHDTQWGRMAFDNDFAYDDFSAVRKFPIKGMQCYCEIIYKQNHWFIWGDGQAMVMNSSRGKPMDVYDLNIERDQLRFLDEMLHEVKSMCVQHKMFFKTFTMYNLIMGYKKVFQLR